MNEVLRCKLMAVNCIKQTKTCKLEINIGIPT